MTTRINRSNIISAVKRPGALVPFKETNDRPLSPEKSTVVIPGRAEALKAHTERIQNHTGLVNKTDKTREGKNVSKD